MVDINQPNMTNDERNPYTFMVIDMIYKLKSYISKLNSARFISTVRMAVLAMLTCGFCCLFAGKSKVFAASSYKPLEVEIAFECLENVNLLDGQYRIRIRAEEEGTPLPNVDHVEVVEGRGSFFVTVTEPGNYSYLVWQDKGKSGDVIYDEAIYEIHLFVLDIEESSEGKEGSRTGELICNMSVNYAGTDEKPKEIAFLNKAAHIEDDPVITPEDGKKTDKNKTSKTGDETNLWLYIGLLIGSAVVILGIVLWKALGAKRDDDPEEQKE